MVTPEQLFPETYVFHDLTPAILFVLHQIERLDNVRVMKVRTDTEFASELLDVVLFRFVFPSFPKFLFEMSKNTLVIRFTFTAYILSSGSRTAG